MICLAFLMAMSPDANLQARGARQPANRSHGIIIGQNALGDAYNRAIREHPEITSESELLAIATADARASLAEALQYLETGVRQAYPYADA